MQLTRIICLQNFGSANYCPQVRIAGVACAVVTWKSDSAITCVTPPNVGSGYDVDMEAVSRASTLSSCYSYDVPLVISALGGNSPAMGTMMTTVTGKNFGSSPLNPLVASILSPRGGGACTSSTWTSDSQMECQTPAGVGGDASVTIGYEGNTKDIGTLTLAFTYDSPSIFYTGFFQGNWKISNVPANTPTVIPISGQNFGTEDYSDQVSVGVTACVTSVWKSDTSLLCTVAKGLLDSHTVVVHRL